MNGRKCDFHTEGKIFTAVFTVSYDYIIAYGHEWLASEHVDRIITTYMHKGTAIFL